MQGIGLSTSGCSGIDFVDFVASDYSRHGPQRSSRAGYKVNERAPLALRV